MERLVLVHLPPDAQLGSDEMKRVCTIFDSTEKGSDGGALQLLIPRSRERFVHDRIAQLLAVTAPAACRRERASPLQQVGATPVSR